MRYIPRCGMPLVLLALALMSMHVSATWSWKTAGKTIVVFGDSLSDNGNVFADPLVGNRTRPIGTARINGTVRKTYFRGRFTNSPGVWNDYLKSLLKSSYISNYAYAGAGICSGYTPRIPIQHIPEQVERYIREKPRSGGKYRPTWGRPTIPIIWSGGNDIQYVLLDDPTQLPALPAKMIACLTNSTRRLLDSGESKVVVATLAPLELSPLAINLGISAQITPLIAGINNGIRQVVTQLNAAYQSQNKSIILLDLHTAVTNTTRNFRQLGFRFNNTQNCLNVPPSFSALLGDVPTFVCSKPDDYLFFDDLHPSSRAHKTIANIILDGLYRNKWITNKDLMRPRKAL